MKFSTPIRAAQTEQALEGRRLDPAQFPGEFQVIVDDMGFELALHEDHQRRNVAPAAADLADLGPDESGNPRMLSGVTGERYPVCARGVFLPRKVRVEIFRQFREQRQPFIVILGNRQQGMLDTLHLGEQEIVLTVHLRDAGQQFIGNEICAHATLSGQWDGTPSIEDFRMLLTEVVALGPVDHIA